MKKLLAAITILLVILCSCQREIDFSQDPSTDPAPGSDTIKAVVFDGPLSPSATFLDYDSLVYSLQATSGSITHFARNGALMWTEQFRYDNQGRVTEYYVDGMNFRHSLFSYTGVDSFPSVAVDSFSDGTLAVHVLNRKSSSTNAGGRLLKYGVQYEAPTSGYSEQYDVNIALNGRGQMVSAGSEGFYMERKDLLFYTVDGLPDSTRSGFTAPAFIDSVGMRLQYTAHSNPLAGLGRMVFKNLYGFLPLPVGYYSSLFSLGSLPIGMYAPRIPAASKEYAMGGFVAVSRSFSYQLQNNIVKSGHVQTTESGFTPSTISVVRIY
jgi:hypothetical protein